MAKDYASSFLTKMSLWKSSTSGTIRSSNRPAHTPACLFLQKNREGTFKYSEVAKLEDPEKQLQVIREHEEYEDDRMRDGEDTEETAYRSTMEF